MNSGKPTVVVTGVSGNLGLRLLPQLGDFSVIGIDVAAPKTDLPIRFVRMDLGLEDSCRALTTCFARRGRSRWFTWHLCLISSGRECSMSTACGISTLPAARA